MKFEKFIDDYVAKRNAKGFEPEPCEDVPPQLRASPAESGVCLWRIVRIDAAPWLESIHTQFRGRLPLLFWALYDRYSFLPFEIGPISIFQNAGTTTFNELACRFAQDATLSRKLADAGYFRFAVMSGGSDQDFVCLDLNRCEQQDCPVVVIDHEAYYLRDRLRVRRDLSPSFQVLFQSAA